MQVKSFCLFLHFEQSNRHCGYNPRGSPFELVQTHENPSRSRSRRVVKRSLVSKWSDAISLAKHAPSPFHPYFSSNILALRFLTSIHFKAHKSPCACACPAVKKSITSSKLRKHRQAQFNPQRISPWPLA
jgi:hypothetical protein